MKRRELAVGILIGLAIGVPIGATALQSDADVDPHFQFIKMTPVVGAFEVIVVVDSRTGLAVKTYSIWDSTRLYETTPIHEADALLKAEQVDDGQTSSRRPPSGLTFDEFMDWGRKLSIENSKTPKDKRPLRADEASDSQSSSK